MVKRYRNRNDLLSEIEVLRSRLEGAGDRPFRTLVESMEEGAVTMTPEEGIILYCNEGMSRMLNTPVDTIIGSRFSRFVPEEDLGLYETMLGEWEGGAGKGELRLIKGNEGRSSVYVSGKRLLTEGIDTLCLVITDLTEKKAHERILASERLARSILEQTGDAVMVCNTSGRIISASKTAGELFGGNPLFKTLPKVLPMDGPANGSGFTLAKVLEGETFRSVEHTLTRGDGRVFHLVLSARPLTNRKEKIIGCVITLTDISDFKRAEEALARSEAKYRVVAENSNDLISWLNPEKEYIFISPSARKITGHDPEEFMRDPSLLLKIVHPDDRALFESHLAHVHAAMKSGELEYRIFHKDGACHWISHYCQPVFDGNIRFSGTRCSDRDITERKAMEAELRDSRERLRQVLGGITDAYLSFDRDWRFVEINPAAERTIFKRPARELIGKVQWEEYPETRDSESYRQYHAAVLEGRPVHFETRSVITAGRWFEVHAYPRAGMLEVYVRDITDRKAMEEAILKSRDEMEREVAKRTHALSRANKLLEDIFTSVHIHIAYLDRNLGFIRVNARFAQAAGYNPEFLVGKNHFQLFPDEENEAVFRRAVDTGEAFHAYEAPFTFSRDPACKAECWDWSLNPLKDADGTVDGLIFTAIDKTAHVHAQEQVRKASHIIENAGFGIAVTKPGSRRFEYVNPAFAKQHGYLREEMVGMSVRDLHTADSREAVRELAREVDAKGHLTFESLHARKDGFTFPVLENVVVVRDKHGTSPYGVLFTEDISRLKKAMDALQENQERLSTVLETLPVGVWIMDRKGANTGGNIAAQDIWGSDRYMVADLFGEHRVWWPEKRKPVKPDEWVGMRAASIGETVLNRELEIEAFDGTRKSVLVSASPLRVRDGKIFGAVIVIQDITAAKQSEKELRRLAAAIEQSYEDVIIADKDGVVEYVNPRFEEHTGYLRREMVGKKMRVPRMGKREGERQRNIWRSVTEGNTWTGRVVRKKKDGTSYESEATVSPVRDGSGRIISTVIVERDVTEQTKLEKQVRQAQKMEAIGTLASGIAHDFNNIIAGIIGFTEMALEEAQMGTALYRRLSLVLKGAHRGRDLVKQILSFSRATEQEKKPLMLSYILDESLKLLRASIPATVEIRKNLSTNSDIILADRTQMHQVILNLATNAAHAMQEKGGVLDVTLSDLMITAQDHGLYPEAKPGPYIRLSFRDTGCGMTPEIMERIFDPFFTTKRPGEGTGLGLSVVHGIVKRHDGLIRVESAPGKGSSFHLLFPGIAFGESPDSLSCEDLARGKGRILFVDDEEMLVEMNRGRFEGLGYEVAGETSALSALQLFRQNPDKFDVIITDYTMPQMTGLELARHILVLKPEMPIILCSGLDELIPLEVVRSAGIRAFLPKAAGRRELISLVQSLLEKKP